MKGSAAFLVLGKPLFCLLLLLSLPQAARGHRRAPPHRDTPQLPLVVTFSLGNQLLTLPD